MVYEENIGQAGRRQVFGAMGHNNKKTAPTLKRTR